MEESLQRLQYHKFQKFKTVYAVTAFHKTVCKNFNVKAIDCETPQTETPTSCDIFKNEMFEW